MKWYHFLLVFLLLALVGYVFFDLVIVAPKRDAKAREDLATLNSSMDLLVCDSGMQLARIHGALAEYEEGSDRLYFRYALHEPKFTLEDRQLLTALHKCAWKVESPYMNGEAWQADPTCVYPIIAK